MVDADKNSSDYTQYMLDRLEEVHAFTDNLDNNKNLCIIGGFDYLYDTIFDTENSDILEKCSNIISSCAQNNIWVQNYSLKLHPLRFMNIVLKSEKMSTKVAAFAALSSLVRGLNMDIKRKFIDVDGVEYLLCLLKDEKYSIKLRTKVMSQVQDLLNYEKHLHENVDYLGKENYTKGKQVNDKPTQQMDKKDGDITVELETEVVENPDKYLSYKDIVKSKLWEGGYVEFYKVLQNSSSDEAIDLREKYMATQKNIILYGKVNKKDFDSAILKDFLLTKKEEITKINKENDGLNENELVNLNGYLAVQ